VGSGSLGSFIAQNNARVRSVLLMQNADKRKERVCNDAFELAAIVAHTGVSCRRRRRQARWTSLSAKEFEAEYHVLSHDSVDDAYAMNGYMG
jgi:hypothetical protein